MFLRWLPPAALVAAALFAGSTHAEDDADRAGHIFLARCANCHFIPDPSLRTDLAWLDQINRTS